MLGPVMPFWYIGSLILTVVLAAVTWSTPTSTTALVAAVLLVISVIMSVALLVPIYKRAKTWTADSLPDDWREQQQRWDRLHYARVAIILAAFTLIAVAATML